ncbi:MAG: hypothetical protein PHP42_00310 [Bacteroidota bacterium]|nr:hypothetical protein [Bacteroidota bacterium]
MSVILDSVWNAEINTYGFTAPPSDEGRGGGNEFDFYVMDLGSGLFGETIPEYDFPISSGGVNPLYASYIRIDNDFGIGYRTKGIQGIMVTCAHEFHHAVQVGGTGIWDQDFYFYELCAEAMEPIVFPTVKDYINDVATYYQHIFNTPLFQPATNSITAGYERAIWEIFLMKKFGAKEMKDLWAELKTFRPVQATQNVLQKYSTSLQREYSDFSLWNTYTNTRADSIKYFADAKLFPTPTYTASITLGTTEESITRNSKSFLSNYFSVISQTDSTVFIVSNANFDDALNTSQQEYPFTLRLSSLPGLNLVQYANSVYGQLLVPDPSQWKLSTVVQGIIFQVGNAACFPNPFVPDGKHGPFLIYLESSSLNSKPDLYIYTSAMDLIYSGNVPTTIFSGRQYAAWDGRDNNNKVVSSGVYIYFLKINTSTIRGKFAVLR